MQRSAYIGGPALEFSLPDAEGVRRHLAEFRQIGDLVLLFIPDVRQFCARWQFWNLLRHYDSFVSLATEVVVIAGNRQDDLRRFQILHDFPFVFLCDPDHLVARRYLAWDRDGGKRISLIIDRRGMIRHCRVETALFTHSARPLLRVLKESVLAYRLQ